MISVVKFVRLLLLPWLLFMASNSTVNIVAANGTPISQPQQQEVLFVQQQQQQHQQQQQEWYLQQLQQQQQRQQQQQQHSPNPIFPAMPLSAPTTNAATQLLPEAAKTAAEDLTTSALPNGVDYSNDTLDFAENPISDDADEKLPSEIQKAVCTVTAGEVRASAEAVTTKKLKGVCGSAELKLAFSDLEAKLYKELQEIKTLLQYITQQQGINVPQMLGSMGVTRTPQKQLNSATATNPYSGTSPTSPATTPQSPPTTTRTQQHKPLASNKPTIATKPNFQPIIEPKSNAVDTSAEVSYEYEESSAAMDAEETLTKKAPQLKSFHTKNQMSAPPSSNELLQEVRKFNNTMLSDREMKVFTYYWKLDNFTERIESGSSTMVESPVFSIKAKPLQLRAYFQHLHRDFLYLQLAHASIKSNNRNNIIIDMGGLFKEIANENVRFKHKISVLNQHNQRSKDLISQEFYNLETGFLIPNSALLGSPFIKNDSLLIQIFLYL
ncbi:PREDICTED: mediator of RNA polymerase II transcription subunit 15 [Rhagoletis zephyria]|uniref:mediator of RNA polymerase II transcription subunit 15 n=1 Tax=Rhagoletis zephyria TaxID=28612 RepID=UPI000811361C|nr:PREDICTED: mediator of RNA polymerase II transcription subunit 15 [Rhagoletis zephyria]